MKNDLMKYIVFIASVFTLTCSNNPTSVDYSKFTIYDAVSDSQGYAEIPYEELFRNQSFVNSSELYIEPLDEDSIELIAYKGGQYYHPVSLSHRCLTFIGTYYGTNNEKYLQRAEKYAQKIISLADIIDSIAYLPYAFDFLLHSDSALLFKAPWYSGMAQGEFLMVAVRLYELTNKQEYLDFANLLFESFVNVDFSKSAWTSRIDSNSYYWIEEYPHRISPGMTLNGYISAIFGVYDYYRVTKDERAKLIHDLTLTTLKRYLPEFRVKDNYSFYCLGHKAVADDFYHNFHIYLLGLLSQTTGDQFFSDFADSLEADGQVVTDSIANL